MRLVDLSPENASEKWVIEKRHLGQQGAMQLDCTPPQDLMELFIKYQVPSDLVTACGQSEPGPGPEAALQLVKGHVEASSHPYALPTGNREAS